MHCSPKPFLVKVLKLQKNFKWRNKINTWWHDCYGWTYSKIKIDSFAYKVGKLRQKSIYWSLCLSYEDCIFVFFFESYYSFEKWPGKDPKSVIRYGIYGINIQISLNFGMQTRFRIWKTMTADQVRARALKSLWYPIKY